MTPGGGFFPYPTGRRSEVNPNMRQAWRGLKRWMRGAAADGHCCSGERSSRTQKERPCVAAMRSSSRTVRSVIGTIGRLSCSDFHEPPSSKETYMPRSVPA
jgi:hypothetical protein